jgi:CheY-like chemotaxis protein
MKRPKTNQPMREPKILVFDDNGQVRTSLARASEFVEFQITTAAGAAEALNLIDTERVSDNVRHEELKVEENVDADNLGSDIDGRNKAA